MPRDVDDDLDAPRRRDVAPQESKRVLAGILAILLGAFGIHKFVLGYTTPGIIMLVVNVVTCFSVMWIIGIVEGIIYLTKTDAEFVETYQVGKKEWF